MPPALCQLIMESWFRNSTEGSSHHISLSKACYGYHDLRQRAILHHLALRVVGLTKNNSTTKQYQWSRTCSATYQLNSYNTILIRCSFVRMGEVLNEWNEASAWYLLPTSLWCSKTHEGEQGLRREMHYWLLCSAKYRWSFMPAAQWACKLLERFNVELYGKK